MPRNNNDRRDGRHEPGWREVVDAVADPAIVIDPTGTILHHNPQIADLYPRARVGLSISAIIRIPELLRAIDQARDAQQPMVVQLHDRVPVTRRLSAIITAMQVEEALAGSPAILIAFRDMTDQEKHAKMRSDFIANASHEMRTPLASLKVIVETLQGAARDDPAARERFLAMMTTQTGRMTRLIDDLLSLSRAEMKAHLPPRDRVDICELLDWVTQSLEPLGQANNVELTYSGGEAGEIWVRGEREELAQVFLNLVQNGIKYGGTPGKVDVIVTVLSKDAGGACRVAVSIVDNGEGIGLEHIPRLTERFYRINVTASREKGGTGLGLAIVKYIVSRHRGELSIDSKIGTGSKFTVTLPIVTTVENAIANEQ